MEDQLKAYRQPLVMATGIILGFIHNFASDFVAYIFEICILVGVVSLIIVVSRDFECIT